MSLGDRFTIEVEVEDITGQMVLRNALLEGKFGEHDFSVETAIPNGSIYIDTGERKFLISTPKMVKAVLEMVFVEE